MATHTAKTNGKSQPKAAVVQASPVAAMVSSSITPNEDQTLNLNITEGWNQTDWINILGGLSVAQAEAHKSGNVADMFGYMRYTQQIGSRLNLGFMQQAQASDLSPPKVMAAGRS